MDLRTRLIAPTFRQLPDGKVGDFDLDSLVKRIILFETYIIDSQGLTELPHLVRVFTFDGLLNLFESGALKLNCSFSITGSMSSSGSNAAKRLQDLFRYTFITTEPAELNEYVNLLLQKIEPMLGLKSSRQIVRFRKAIYSSLEHPKDESGFAIKATQGEFASSPNLLKSALVIALRKSVGIHIAPTDIEIIIRSTSENDFSAESNIHQKFGINRFVVHQVIENACLAIAKRNDRIEQMKRFSALTGFSDIDIPIFGDKLEFLASVLSPSSDEKRFQRVIELAGLPQLDNRTTSIDAKQLLSIRQSTEAREFRQWLSITDALSDADIIHQVRSLSKTIGRVIGGTLGRNIRFLLTNGVGFIPVAGSIASIPLSILDQFILDKIFPRSGISAFVDEMYPSLFEKG
jgi:hypothetical protein